MNFALKEGRVLDEIFTSQIPARRKLCRNWLIFCGNIFSMYLLTFFFKSGFFCKRNFKRKTRSSRVLHLDNFLQNFSQLFTLYVLLSCCWLPSDASVLSLLGYDNAVIVPQCDPLNLCSECYWHSCVFTEQADIVNGTACVTECTLILCYYDQDFVLSSVGVSGVWIWNSIENIGNYCLFFFWILFWKKKKTVRYLALLHL